MDSEPKNLDTVPIEMDSIAVKSIRSTKMPRPFWVLIRPYEIILGVQEMDQRTVDSSDLGSYTRSHEMQRREHKQRKRERDHESGRQGQTKIFI